MLNQLSTFLFWDVNQETLDVKKHAQFIIERVLQRGTYNDWRYIQTIYTKRKIKSACLKARYIDKYSLSYCSCIFKTPLEKFRCYTEIQSNPNYWNS